jgi:hypothetical protein
VAVEPVRAHAERLDDAANRARLHEFGRRGDRPHLEALGIAHRPDPPGLGHDAPQLRELIERRAARLVAHHVLAAPHGLERDPRPLAGDARGDDQPHLRVVEQPPPVVHAPEVWETLGEALERLRLALGPVAGALAAQLDQASDLLVDVPVVEADRGELEGRQLGLSHPDLQRRRPRGARARRAAARR